MFEIVICFGIVLFVLMATVGIPRAIYHTICCPPNHPANIRERRRRWRFYHPDAMHTPFDEKLAELKNTRR